MLLTAYTLRVLQPLDAEFTRLADLDTAISTLAAATGPSNSIWSPGEDYAAAEQGALILQTTIMQLALLTDDYGALNRLEDAGAAYLNLLRSYHNPDGGGRSGEYPRPPARRPRRDRAHAPKPSRTACV